MSAIKSHDAELTPLLRRAIMDDGPEAETAFYLFKKKLRKSALDVGNIYYLDRTLSNPLLFVVREKDAEIAFLREQLDEAYATINGEAVIAKAPAFPWGDFPKEEAQMCRDFASKKGAAPSFVNRWIEVLSKVSGVEVTEGSIKQRTGNNMPPSALISEPLPLGSPTNWLELWFIGSTFQKRQWKDVLFKRLGLSNRAVGSPIKDIDIAELDVLRKEIVAVIADRGKSNGETLQWSRRKVFEAGAEGISRKALIALDPANSENISKRINDLIKTRVVFRLANKTTLVHRDFKDAHMTDWITSQEKLDRRASSLLASLC